MRPDRFNERIDHFRLNPIVQMPRGRNSAWPRQRSEISLSFASVLVISVNSRTFSPNTFVERPRRLPPHRLLRRPTS